MKKIILKKRNETVSKSKSYKLNYELELNKSQYDAVFHTNGAALVIAGAGTGKTRTLTYRVAKLIEDGIAPESILLLTFTRKSASEMLRRASTLLDGRCDKVSGGTFHSFASMILRHYSKFIGYNSSFNIIDMSDSNDVINLIRNDLNVGSGKKRFPQKSTLGKIFSLSANKRESIENIIENGFNYFLDLKEEIIFIHEEYSKYKRKYNLMDYDDLLINLLKLMKENPQVLGELNLKYRYVMVDEYQDSNKLQHEISLLFAGKDQNIMAVGDDAQSIYSFRGADFQNIMYFPESFGSCAIYKIEENYRSTAQILEVTNNIIQYAVFKYDKTLKSKRVGDKPKIIEARDERMQSAFIVQQVLELREEEIPLNEIAVLFRSAFHSFDLEIELEKANIPFRKFGGLKFIETAHIKDIISYLRIISNPKDAISWQRVLMLLEGVGPRTAGKIIEAVNSDKLSLDKPELLEAFGIKKENITDLFSNLKKISNSKISIGDKVTLLTEYYRPILQSKYDDWQKRWSDLQTFVGISERYDEVGELLTDMALEPPNESVSGLEPEDKQEEYLNLSTIHSAKGLEYKAVFLIWALEGKFPSAKSVDNLDTIEEERRLFYVAATRAKDYLYISYPTNIYDRESGFVLSEPSRFIKGLSDEIIDRYILDDE